MIVLEILVAKAMRNRCSCSNPAAQCQGNAKITGGRGREQLLGAGLLGRCGRSVPGDGCW